MSACKCPERGEPLHGDEARAGRLWRVYKRQCNYSAFNGYRWTPSAYSSLLCIVCGAMWRTRAKYVAELPDSRILTAYPNPGTEAHAVMMRQYGRAGFERVPT